ncbi:MBL fold metallo-hydrolase [Neokomagataea tanensis]|uniref:MBL fold metallo-hydrolase n=1 Tax=Neokomagataea TaxID=1223423 RepID=UPI001F0E871A|nr:MULTISPECIES: MBL fold metallo-hydrolase [Neokomagataea]
MTDTAIKSATDSINQVLSGALHTPVVKAFFDAATNTFSYVVHCPVTRSAAIIDSVLDYDAAAGRTTYTSAQHIIDYVRAAGLEVQWQLETHVHADHLSAAPWLQEKLGGRLGIGAEIIRVQNVFGKIFNAGSCFARDGSQFDVLFRDGQQLELGTLSITALHLPGHTPADMAYVIGDAVFVGDTIFMPDFGTARADFPGGDARQLFRSIQRLLTLPPDTTLYLCHDYKAPGRDEFCGKTTVRDERDGNIHVQEGVSEESFVKMRTERDASLSMPKLLMPSVQVNMRGGHLPEPESDGVSYIKIPINKV